MTDRFAALVTPVFLYVLAQLERIADSTVEDPDPNEVASKLRQMLSGFNVRGESEQETQLVKSALTYWIDEVLINSTWTSARFWRDHTLEREIYGSRNRAWKFFEDAKAARNLHNRDALEVYYLCVCFGFQGLFRDKDAATLSGEMEIPTNIPRNVDTDTPADNAAPPGEGTKDLSWWSGDESETTGESWQFDGDSNFDKPSNSGFEEPSPRPVAAPMPTGSTMAKSIEEWSAAIFREVVPEVQGEFVPLSQPDTLRDASPLGGRQVIKTSAITFICSTVTAILLLLIKLVWI